MKRVMTVLAALAVSAAVHAQSGGMKGMDMKDMDMKDMDKKGMDMKGMEGKKDKKAAKGASHSATGVVTEVDEANSKVTIKHEPIQSLNWPSMTMTFNVKDKTLLEKAKSGEKVQFSFVQSGKDYTITRIK